MTKKKEIDWGYILFSIFAHTMTILEILVLPFWIAVFLVIGWGTEWVILGFALIWVPILMFAFGIFWLCINHPIKRRKDKKQRRKKYDN